MKKWLALVACVGLGLAGPAAAQTGGLRYSGYQPWWDVFAHRKGLMPEEERLQRFWHDYYDALRRYYAELDHIDWVAYYKNHGYQVNAGGCKGGACAGCQKVGYAPVFVPPKMQWAVPAAGPGQPRGPSGSKSPREKKAGPQDPDPNKASRQTAPRHSGAARTARPASGPDDFVVYLYITPVETPRGPGPGRPAAEPAAPAPVPPPERKAGASRPAPAKTTAESAGPKARPQGRSPDDFELFLERKLDAPRSPGPGRPAAKPATPAPVTYGPSFC
jgi:hypothetical protein